MRPVITKDMKPIDPADIRGIGPTPQLDWLPIGRLRFDDSYQRPIRAQGVSHLRRIAEQFDWRLFAPVIVAPIEGGLFAVIDGQHRTHAAALRGIEKVPCQIVIADRKLQAKAFAGMNGSQAIRLAPYQVHRAAVISGNAKAIAVDHACAQAGAKISTNKPSDLMERGETVAVMTLYKLLAEYGSPVVIATLRALIAPGGEEEGAGNIGLINALTLPAYASVFARRRDLMDHPQLIDALAGFALAVEIEDARRTSAKQGEQRTALSQALEAFLDEELHPSTQQAQVPA